MPQLRRVENERKINYVLEDRVSALHHDLQKERAQKKEKVESISEFLDSKISSVNQMLEMEKPIDYTDSYYDHIRPVCLPVEPAQNGDEVQYCIAKLASDFVISMRKLIFQAIATGWGVNDTIDIDDPDNNDEYEPIGPLQKVSQI